MNTATREIPPLVSGPVSLSRYSYATPIMMARAATGPKYWGRIIGSFSDARRNFLDVRYVP